MFGSAKGSHKPGLKILFSIVNVGGNSNDLKKKKKQFVVMLVQLVII